MKRVLTTRGLWLTIRNRCKDLLFGFGCALVIFSSVPNPAFAATVTPGTLYGWRVYYPTVVDVVYAYYLDWEARYGMRQCAFSELSWVEEANRVAMYIPNNPQCGYAQVTQYAVKDKFCPDGYAPNVSPNPTICTRPDNTPDPGKKYGHPQTCEGDPCDAGSGNSYQVESDYRGPSGAYGVQAVRYYNNGPGSSRRWGSNWRDYYDRSIAFNASSAISTATLNRQDGRVLYFNLVNSQWVADADIVGTLARLTDGSGSPTGWTYTNGDDEIETYDASGRLISLANRAGVVQALTYSCGPAVSPSCPVPTPASVAPVPGLLIAVKDQFGRQLRFSYDGSPRVARMVDPVGQLYTFAYSGSSASDNLVSVTYPDNRVRQYLYGETAYTQGANLPHALTGLLDENGKRYTTWRFDPQGRALSSEHDGGIDKVTLTYNTDGTTAVLDALGGARSYQFQTILGVIKSTSMTRSQDAATRTKTYDAKGNVASRTDFNGNQTTYTYDLARNLETSRVEAAGTAQARTITTEWHLTYRLPTRIAEPKRITTNTYDTAGNLLTKTVQATLDTNGSQGFAAAVDGSPRVWSYTYNTVGQVLTAIGPRTDVLDKTAYAYDTSGNLASITNAANQATTLSNYDLNGRVGRITDPNGLITDLTYSPRGWLISKTVDGELTGYEYDGVGQLKKVTLPDASLINYTYDDAHRLTAIADRLGNRIDYTLDAIGNHINEQVKDPGGVLARQTTRVYDALNRLLQITGGVQ